MRKRKRLLDFEVFFFKFFFTYSRFHEVYVQKVHFFQFFVRIIMLGFKSEKVKSNFLYTLRENENIIGIETKFNLFNCLFCKFLILSHCYNMYVLTFLLTVI
jgi:hypothetical protein